MASPEPTVIDVELSDGEGARVRWAPPPVTQEREDDPSSAWRLESEPDWRRLESIRLISARFEDDTALGVVTVRPRGARAHGDDVSIARLTASEDEETATSEALVSVEYDGAGVPRRLGIELWTDPDSAPVRAAADRTGQGVRRPDRAEAVVMRFRLGGIAGVGLYEVLREP